MKPDSKTLFKHWGVPLGILTSSADDPEIVRPELDRFLSKAPEWERRLSSGEPVYALTPTLIRQLSSNYGSPFSAGQKTRKRRPALLNPEAANAEQLFYELCGPYRIGVQDGLTIGYGLLLHETREEMLKKLGAGFAGEIGRYLAWFQPARDQALAYVGWLMTNPVFLEELKVIKKRWEKLRSQLPMPIHYPMGEIACSAKARSFLAYAKLFFDRWWLDGMATWDLPCPQGVTHLHGSLKEQPRDYETSLLLCVPGYLNIPTTCGLVEALRSLLQKLPRRPLKVVPGSDPREFDGPRCLPGDELPVVEPGRYASMFRATHYYKAITSRYPPRERSDEAQIRYAISCELRTGNGDDPSRWVNVLLREAKKRLARNTSTLPSR